MNAIYVLYNKNLFDYFIRKVPTVRLVKALSSGDNELIKRKHNHPPVNSAKLGNNN